MTRVLVPTDGSEMSENALEYAIEEHPDATLHLLHVTNVNEAGYAVMPGDPDPDSSEEWYQAAEEQAEAILEEARDRAEAHGADVETEIEVGEPARAIEETAEREEVDHVVIGSHGREGLSRILLGSVAEKVVRRSPVPVTVVR